MTRRMEGQPQPSGSSTEGFAQLKVPKPKFQASSGSLLYKVAVKRLARVPVLIVLDNPLELSELEPGLPSHYG